MNPCDNCKKPEGVKCCHNCKIDAYGCGVNHECMKDCPEWQTTMKTNAQRYREQLATDEGLAEFLMKAHDGEVNIPFCRSDVACKGENDPMGERCKACMMAYLNSQAEEG